MFKFNLRYKLLVYSVILAIVPLGLAGRTMTRITQDELKSSANEVIGTTVEQIVNDMDDLFLDTWLAPLRLVASGIDNELLGGEEKLALIQSGILNITDVVACQISIETVDEPILITKDDFTSRLKEAGLDPAEVLTVKRERIDELLARADNEIFFGDMVRIQASDDWLFTIIIPLATPIADQNADFVVRINLNRLRGFIDNHPFNRIGTITLIDSRGRRVFDPDRTDLNENAMVSEVRSLMASSSGAVGVKPYIRPDKERMIAGFSFPRHFKLAVITEQSERDAYLVITRMLRTLFTIVAIVLSIAVITAIYFALRISRPVEEMAAAAQKVREGDLDVWINPPGSSDEISLLATRMNDMISGLRERDRIRNTFGQYLSSDVVNAILESPTGASLGGEKRELTILMSDLRGFTSIGERMAAEDVVAIINIYLGLMTEIILKYEGTIDEFIGDAIFVIFGAPVISEDHAQRAVACAIEMQEAMAEVNQRCRAANYPEVHQGIGINTGDIVVGNIGSEKRMKYGCVGRNVNLTARVESYTVGGQIFISESTRNSCGDILRIDDRMKVSPKGVREPITIYEVGAIGGAYNIERPKRQQAAFTELSRPVKVEFTVLAGKHAGDKRISGTFTRLAQDAALLHADIILERLVNIKIKLLDQDGVEVCDDLYAKVTGDEGRKDVVITFTSTPPAVATYFQTILTLPAEAT